MNCLTKITHTRIHHSIRNNPLNRFFVSFFVWVFRFFFCDYFATKCVWTPNKSENVLWIMQFLECLNCPKFDNSCLSFSFSSPKKKVENLSKYPQLIYFILCHCKQLSAWFPDQKNANRKIVRDYCAPLRLKYPMRLTNGTRLNWVNPVWKHILCTFFVS